MLTVRYRLNNRFRPIEADPELLAAVAAAAAAPPPPPEPIVNIKLKVDEPTGNDDQILIEKIRQIEEENRYLRRENLFFIRYLRRIQTTKVVETFKDYREIDDSIVSEILGDLDPTKFNDSVRRTPNRSPVPLLIRKGSGQSSKGSLYHVRLSSSRSSRERNPISPFPIVIQKRVSLARYELEQTRLELERMTTNANADLENLRLIYRMAASDAISQARLIHEVERYIERYRISIGDEEFYNPRLKVPGELVVSRINKRINSRVTVIGLVRANNQRLHLRLEEIHRKIQNLNELHEKMDDVDVTLNTTRRIDHVESYAEIERIYKEEKRTQFPSFVRVQRLKKILEEEEHLWNETKKKIVMLKHIYEENQREIEHFQRENQRIAEENTRLSTRLTQVWKVPSITEYAYVIKQMRYLEEQIEIWTQRVAMVEAFHAQLKHQEKSQRVLPPLAHPSLSSSFSNLLN